MQMGRCEKALVAKLKGDAIQNDSCEMLQGDKTSFFFCRKMSGCEATGRLISVPVFMELYYPWNSLDEG